MREARADALLATELTSTWLALDLTAAALSGTLSIGCALTDRTFIEAFLVLLLGPFLTASLI